MRPKEIKTITIKDAINEIYGDFVVFNTQYDLFIKVFTFIVKGKAWIGMGALTSNWPEQKGVWFQPYKSNKKSFFPPFNLPDIIQRAFAENPIPIKDVIHLYKKVMKIKAFPGTNPGEILVETEMEKFKCKQCGNCCLNLPDAYCTRVTPEDYQRWEKERRKNIIKYIQYGELWYSPKTGIELDRCPWLRKKPNKNKYQCLIHTTKPTHCQLYPLYKKHALITGCKGFNNRI